MKISIRPFALGAAACAVLLFSTVSTAQTIADPAAQAQQTQQPPPTQPPQPATPPPQRGAQVIPCSSNLGERQHCEGDTSVGVVLVRSTGQAPCLLGRTWGYDATGVWVSDGCAGDFLVRASTEAGAATAQEAPDYVPNAGFLLFDGEKGQIYFRLFSYVRYLNQKGIDATYTDGFGNTKTVQQRQDVQLQKFFAPFSGWFLTPKFRYYLYVWSSNPSQGDAAQVVGAGNLSFTFNRFVTVGGGITSLPTVRSTEGQFPYWLGVDGRLIADEYFRGSYTNGVWVKGELAQKVKYMAMFATNLSILGVSASQLDNKFDTQSYMLQWLPTTGEFGLWGTFGDYDFHEKAATRVGLHFSHSFEDKQSQPGTNGIENSQIRLSDGSVIFTPDLFGAGVTVNNVDYKMTSVDAGFKFKGVSVEGEYYWRWLGKYEGINVGGVPDIHDTGYQLQTSAMLVPKYLQAYLSGSQIFGDYGDPSEVRIGSNYYIVGQRGLRVNAELLFVKKSPVGYTAYPMPVGANGRIFHLNFEMNF